MHESGETAYYRRPEDNRAHRCEIISYANGCYTVKGMRTATCSRRPIITVPADQVFPVDQIGRNKPVKYRREFHGRGLSVPVSESLQRKEATEARLGMSEGAVLFSDPMQRLCRQIVRRLCRSNGINQQHAEYNELTAEYTAAALQAVRTAASKADESDLESFRRFIAGEDHVFGKIVLSVARTSKTAVVRYLQHRQQYQQTHMNLDTLERRYAA